MCSDADPSDSLGAPDPDRGGADIDEAVEASDAGSQAAGQHGLAESGPSGQSRVEQMPDVEGAQGHVEGDPDGTVRPPIAGPEPGDVGAGGAQRIVGSRIVDRIAGGESVPDGPPFDADSEGEGYGEGD